MQSASIGPRMSLGRSHCCRKEVVVETSTMVDLYIELAALPAPQVCLSRAGRAVVKPCRHLSVQWHMQTPQQHCCSSCGTIMYSLSVAASILCCLKPLVVWESMSSWVQDVRESSMPYPSAWRRRVQKLPLVRPLNLRCNTVVCRVCLTACQGCRFGLFMLAVPSHDDKSSGIIRFPADINHPSHSRSIPGSGCDGVSGGGLDVHIQGLSILQPFCREHQVCGGHQPP